MAVALAAGTAVLLLIGAPALNGEPGTAGDTLAQFAPFFAFGAVLRAPRRWWWLAVVSVPVLLGAPSILHLLFGDWRSPDRWEVIVALQYAVAVFAGASIRPMATMRRRAIERPVTLLVACNVLNVADALLTAIGSRVSFSQSWDSRGPATQ